ncbi:hypothetical protein [Mycoplasma zalophidermidis]|uniref:Phage-Barnase-EndoU-ColicinE5/D-RelE like nuclease 4 domain-containing protein n=2 Tax=Mycoplasma zalophidermidis TaxID=398174 RepID=A0ABS6DTP9_9MOLU|nr:hypothetical protein [Mycoplasma zalophidermidis]MBU4689895.1 hypothetical protein [Mycoplasma zalophidermidis]MBU4693814.1 hypothetical protein [Mycoplasma zalophidermidis]MCR8966820.1 hypothetical protein [Mycoplasma zalophidermidis]
MQINNTTFKSILISYFSTFIKTKSISFMSWPNKWINYQIRIEVVWNKNFIFHSLGLSKIKNKIKNNYKVNEFISDVYFNRLSYSNINQLLTKNKKRIVMKKLLAINWITSRFKDKGFFINFKIKKSLDKPNAFEQSECILYSKPLENKIVALHCKIGNKYNLDIKNNRSIFWNNNKDTLNIVVIPISIKLLKKDNIKLDNFRNINWTFLNEWINKKTSVEHS